MSPVPYILTITKYQIGLIYIKKILSRDSSVAHNVSACEQHVVHKIREEVECEGPGHASPVSTWQRLIWSPPLKERDFTRTQSQNTFTGQLLVCALMCECGSSVCQTNGRLSPGRPPFLSRVKPHVMEFHSCFTNKS